MTKHQSRWPLWKIGLTTAICAVSSGVLFWLAALAQGALPKATTAPSDPSAAVGLPNMIILFGLIGAVLTLMGLLWLGLRLWELRKPVWERGKKKRHRY